MKKEFKLGPIQELWITTLEKYPERQTQDFLGVIQNGEVVEACCLGQGKACLLEYNGETLRDGLIKDGPCNLDEVLGKSFSKLGLRNPEGEFDMKQIVNKNIQPFHSLTEANDGGCSWLDIATFMRASPEAIFVKSV